jgi:AcrR family transcriptional regulator
MRKEPPDPGVLDTSAIVGTALAIADKEGLDAVSMRRVAANLDVTPMALYYYVENKDQLVDLMADQSLQELPAIDPNGSWETELEHYFLGIHRLFIAHPALAEAMTHRPLEGPTAIRVGEQLFHLLTSAGFEDGDAVAAFLVLFNYTIGASVYRLSRALPHGERLESLTADAAPLTHRMRDLFADASSEAHFVTALRRLIECWRPQKPRKGRRN